MIQDLFLWSLKASLVLTLLYITYMIIFRQQANHNIKRTVLLSIVGLTLTFSVCQFNLGSTPISLIPPDNSLLRNSSINSELTSTPAIETPSEIVEEQKTSILTIATMAYTIGLMVSISIFLYTVAKLIFYFFNGTRRPDLGHNIIEHSSIKSSFSFLNWIFIPVNAQHENTVWEIIKKHESIHIKQWHSLDALAINMLQHFMWFNPFIYLFQKEIKNIHELLADQQVLKTVDSHTYTKVILGLCTNEHSFQLGQDFAHSSSIIKRIKAMDSKKTSTVKTSMGVIAFMAVTSIIGLQAMAQTQPIQNKTTLATNQVFTGDGVDGTMFSTQTIEDSTGQSPHAWISQRSPSIVYPLILTEQQMVIVNSVRESFEKKSEDDGVTYEISIELSKTKESSSIFAQIDTLYKDNRISEFVSELSVEERINLYEESKNWAEKYIPKVYPDYDFISELAFIKQKYLIIRSKRIRENNGNYRYTEVFEINDVNKAPEPIGGHDRFLRNVSNIDLTGSGIKTDDLPKNIEFEFLVSPQGRISRLNLTSKISGDDISQDRVYKLMGKLNRNIIEVSRAYGWRSALIGNEPVACKSKISIPREYFFD